MRSKALLSVFAASIVSAQAPNAADIQSHLRQAQQQLQNNRPDLAIREYRAVLQADPKNLDARGNLGVLLFFQGDYAKAAPELSAAVAQQPTLFKLQALLGMCQRRAGRLDDARRNLEQGFPRLEETKLRIQAGMELIELYFGSGDLDKAAGIASAIKQLDPANPEIL